MLQLTGKELLCRFPHGKRGLKFMSDERDSQWYTSLPSWEAWIEVATLSIRTYMSSRRFPHGKRGLKLHGLPYTTRASHVASLMGSVD